MNQHQDKTKIAVLQYVSLAIISIVSGILIGLFTIGIKYVFDGINKIVDSSIETSLPIILYSIITSVIVIAFYILLIITKLSIGRADETLNRFLSNEKIKIYEFPLLLIGFFLSLFSGLPVGAIEISQCIGVGLTSEVYKRTIIKDNDSFDCVSAASFGAFFMSPLAGLSYSLESRKYRVNLSFILKALLSVVIMAGSCYVIKMIFNLHNVFIFRIEKITSFSWESLWIYFCMGIAIAVCSLVLNVSTLKLRKVFSTNKKFKNATSIITLVIMVAALLCTLFGLKYQYYTFSLAGYDGRIIFLSYDNFKRIGLLVGTLFLWGLYIILLPHTRLIGGKILPLMAFGSLVGLCFVWNGKSNNLIKTSEHFLMITTAMFAMFGVVYKKPLTAFCLAITFSRWSVIPYQILPFILAAAPGYLLLHFTKIQSLNECLELPDSLNIV